jgi:hypothetical protein
MFLTDDIPYSYDLVKRRKQLWRRKVLKGGYYCDLEYNSSQEKSSVIENKDLTSYDKS